MSYAERVAEHVAEANVVAAGLFQRRGTAVSIGADGGSPATHDPEREAPGFPSNTILAVTDAPALYAFHRNPGDGMIGRWPLGEVGAKYDTRESNVNHLEFVGTAELLLTFPTARRPRSNAANATTTAGPCAWQSRPERAS